MSQIIDSSETTFTSQQSSSKFSLNISTFNRCPAPKSLPTQPTTKPIFGNLNNNNVYSGLVRPL